MPKTKQRTVVAIFILLLLILVPHNISIFSIEISVGYLFFLSVLYGFLCQMNMKTLLFTLCTSILVAAGYATFQLVSIYDPVVHLIDGRVMSMAIVVVLASVVSMDWSKRVIISLSGLLHGELLYGLTVRDTFMMHAFGHLYLFDVIALSSVILSGGWFIHDMSKTTKRWLQEKNERQISEQLSATKE